MKIIFEPKSRYIEQITNWLFEEKEKKIHGFYYNFINTDFTKENFICLVNEKDEAIGYFHYQLKEKHGSIEVAVIKQDEKKKGYGRLLLDSLIEHFLNNK